MKYHIKKVCFVYLLNFLKPKGFFCVKLGFRGFFGRIILWQIVWRRQNTQNNHSSLNWILTEKQKCKSDG